MIPARFGLARRPRSKRADAATIQRRDRVVAVRYGARTDLVKRYALGLTDAGTSYGEPLSERRSW
jgi:hypothetical protein